MCGIESEFTFKNYKIDVADLKILPSIDILEYEGGIRADAWEYQIRIRNPLFFKKKNYYVGGIDCIMSIFPKKILKKEKKRRNAIIYFHAGISGIFEVFKGEFEGEVEENLVKLQIPAILFPYLRAFVGSVLGNAGFGTINIPLINIQKLSDEVLKDVEIEIKE